jgi:hypothetical protein
MCPQCIYFALKIYQRCVAEGKSEDAAEGEKPSNDLDFVTVVSQEFETKFKVTVEKLIRDSAGTHLIFDFHLSPFSFFFFFELFFSGAMKSDSELADSSSSSFLQQSTERDVDLDRSETDDVLTDQKEKEEDDRSSGSKSQRDSSAKREKRSRSQKTKE